MSMYYNADELQTIATAVTSTPNLSNLFFDCAWRYACYDKARTNENDYLATRTNNRPTKDRERVRVTTARKFGEFWSLLSTLRTLCEPYGTIHAGTIHDEIIELSNGSDPIAARRRLLALANND